MAPPSHHLQVVPYPISINHFILNQHIKETLAEDVGIAQWLGAHDCKPNDQSSIHVGDEFLEFS